MGRDGVPHLRCGRERLVPVTRGRRRPLQPDTSRGLDSRRLLEAVLQLTVLPVILMHGGIRVQAETFQEGAAPGLTWAGILLVAQRQPRLRRGGGKRGLRVLCIRQPVGVPGLRPA